MASFSFRVWRTNAALIPRHCLWQVSGDETTEAEGISFIRGSGCGVRFISHRWWGVVARLSVHEKRMPRCDPTESQKSLHSSWHSLQHAALSGGDALISRIVLTRGGEGGAVFAIRQGSRQALIAFLSKGKRNAHGKQKHTHAHLSATAASRRPPPRDPTSSELVPGQAGRAAALPIYCNFSPKPW